MTTLTFRTEVQAALFEYELMGQISDGHWENKSPSNHWEAWSDALVLVGSAVGRNFNTRHDKYNFCSKELITVVVKRMLGIARVTLAFGRDSVETLRYLYDCEGWEGVPNYEGDFWDDRRKKIIACIAAHNTTIDAVQGVVNNDSKYTIKDLLADLREMKQTIKVYCPTVTTTQELIPTNTVIAPVDTMDDVSV